MRKGAEAWKEDPLFGPLPRGTALEARALRTNAPHCILMHWHRRSSTIGLQVVGRGHTTVAVALSPKRPRLRIAFAAGGHSSGQLAI